VAILGNLEFDHADIFDSLGDIEKQFGYLLRSIPRDGVVVINADDARLESVLEKGCWSTVTLQHPI